MIMAVRHVSGPPPAGEQARGGTGSDLRGARRSDAGRARPRGGEEDKERQQQQHWTRRHQAAPPPARAPRALQLALDICILARSPSSGGRNADETYNV